MLKAAGIKLAQEIPKGASVLDVGGGFSPFPRANWVIDLMDFNHRYSNPLESKFPVHYSKETWVQRDICDRTPWPFRDKEFDFSTCSHLLEDVRDPIWVCAELIRVSKAGYIEVPSRIEEQSLGVENPRYAGYYHHRWLVDKIGSNTLEFRLKPHSLHSMRDAIVAKVGPCSRIRSEHAILSMHWNGEFKAIEIQEASERKVNDELCDLAQRSRAIPNLLERTPMSIKQKVLRSIYYARLYLGLR